MSRIKTYDNDATLNAGDRLLGTDVLNNSTKNFTLESLAEFINGAPGGGGTGGNPITAATFTKSGDRVTLTLTPTTGDPIVASFIEDLNEGTIHTGSLDPVTAQVSGSPGDFYIQRDTTGDTPIVNFYGPLVRATTATDFSSWNNVGPQTLIGIQGEQGDRGFQGDGTEVTSVVSGANPGDTSSVTFTNTDIDTTAGTSTTSTETVTIQPGVQGDQGIGINTITAPANPTAGATQTVTVALTDPSGDTTPSNQVFQVPSGAQGIQGVGVSDAIGSIIADGETNAGDTNLTFTLTDPLDSSTSTTTAVRVRRGGQGVQGFKGDSTEVTSTSSGANPGDTSTVTFTNTGVDATAGTPTTSTETVTIQPGVRGVQGVQGLFSLDVYTISAITSPPTIAPTGGVYTLSSSSITTEPTSTGFTWTSDVPTGLTAGQEVYISRVLINPSSDTAATISLGNRWAIPFQAGAQGATGSTGARGSRIFRGTGTDNVPTTATDSLIGDYFFNTTNATLYGPATAVNTFPATGTLLRGDEWFTTSTQFTATTIADVSAFTGVRDGDIILVSTGTAAGNLFEVSAHDATTSTATLTAAGNIRGAVGMAGTNGTAILNGTVAPTDAIGNSGDFYVQRTTNSRLLFGPKDEAAGNQWGTGVELVGEDGDDGTTWFTTSTQLTATTSVDVSAFTGVRDGDIILVNTGTGVGNLFEVSAHDATASTATLTAAGNIRGAVGMPGTNGTAVLNGTVAPTDAIGNSGDFYVQRTTNSRLLFGPKDEAAGNQWGTGVELVGEDGDDGTTWFTTATQLTATAGVDVSSFTGIIDGDIILINSGAGVGNLFTISAHDATANTATLTADGNIRGATGSAGDDGTTWFTTATQLTATTGVDVSAFTGIVDGDTILVNTGDDRGNLFTISAHSATANTATLTASGNIRGAMGGDGSDGTTWFSTATQIAPATGADVSSFTGIVDGDIILVNAGAGAGNLFTISAHDATANTATLTADGNIRGAMGMRGFAGDDGTTWFTTATQLTATTGVDVSAFTGIVNGDIILVNTGAGGGNLFIVSAHDAAANTATLTANGNIRGTAGSDGTTWFSTPTQFSAGTGVNVSALNDITDGDIILVNTGAGVGNLFTVSAHSATANTATLTASGNIRGADGGATDGTDGIIPFFDTTSTSGLGDTSTRFFPSGMVSLDPNFSALTVTPSDGIYTIQNGSYLINDGGTTSAITNLNNVVPLGALTTIGTNTYMLVAAGTASFDLKRIANTAGATALATGVTDSVINPTAGNVLQFNFSDTFNDDGAEFSNERLRVEELFVEENTIVREDVEANSFIARTGVTFSDSSSQTSAVAGNPTGGATVELEKVFIEGVIYSIGQSAQSATFNGVLSPITRTVGQTGSRSTISVENIPILHHSGFTYDINSVVVPTGWTADNINNTPDDATFRIIIPEAAQNTTGTFTIAVNLTSTDTTATPATTHTETIHGVFNLEPFAAPPTLLDCYVGILPEAVTNTTITGAQVDGFTDTGIVRPENRLIDAASTGTFSRRSHTWFMYDPSLTLISVTEGGVNIDLSAEQTITVTDSTATPSRNGTYSAKRITDVVIDNASDGLSYTNLIFN